jgi:hypothetical protein
MIRAKGGGQQAGSAAAGAAAEFLAGALRKPAADPQL